jgi:hypothetical protein
MTIKLQEDAELRGRIEALVHARDQRTTAQSRGDHISDILVTIERYLTSVRDESPCSVCGRPTSGCCTVVVPGPLRETEPTCYHCDLVEDDCICQPGGYFTPWKRNSSPSSQDSSRPFVCTNRPRAAPPQPGAGSGACDEWCQVSEHKHGIPTGSFSLPSTPGTAAAMPRFAPFELLPGEVPRNCPCGHPEGVMHDQACPEAPWNTVRSPEALAAAPTVPVTPPTPTVEAIDDFPAYQAKRDELVAHRKVCRNGCGLPERFPASCGIGEALYQETRRLLGASRATPPVPKEG